MKSGANARRSLAVGLVIVVTVLVIAGIVLVKAKAPSSQKTEVEFLTDLFTSDTLPTGTVYDSGVKSHIGTEEPEPAQDTQIAPPWESEWMQGSFPNCTPKARQSIFEQGIMGFGLFPDYNGPEFVQTHNAVYHLKPTKVELLEGSANGAQDYQATLEVTGSPDYTTVVAKGRIQLDGEGSVSYVSFDGVYNEQGERIMTTLLGLNDPAQVF